MSLRTDAAPRAPLSLPGIVSALAAIAVAFALLAAPAYGQDEKNWRHGLSLFGDIKYPEGFEHFDYVKADAPKGGTARMATIGTFDSLNPFTYKGSPGGLVGLTFDTLMKQSYDEPSSEYGLVAEAVSYPDDYSSVTFRLRAEARWHDGEPITPEDVIFSLNALREAHYFYRAYYANIETVEKTGEREVTFTFDQTGNRELPQITGQLPILAKHWWEQEGRDVNETTLEPPLGSGPYKVAEVNTGRSMSVTRVEDYWAKDLPVNAGYNNFDTIVMDYYRDSTIALEAFKADRIDWREENSAKNWATAYDFSAVDKGRVVLEEIPSEQGTGMQAFAFNLRRDLFKDRRVRKAFNMVFDFDWMNRALFYDQYVRTNSYFENSDLAATGAPGEAELALLEPLKEDLPEEVLTQAFENPDNSDARAQRANLREAAALLEEAGWRVENGRLISKDTGEPFEFEILLVQPSFERVALAYAKPLQRLGIEVNVRTVDSSQYRQRLDTFDFDMTVASWPQSLSPGNEQRDFWGSEAAATDGSRNVVGIDNPAVDALIDKVIYATDRDGLIAATRALDRVLLWNYYVVPQWHIPYDRVARWDRFGKPAEVPAYNHGFPGIWWWDKDKADAVAAKK